MTISTRDQLIDAMGNNSSRLVLDNASIANTVAGQFISLSRATGQPAQPAKNCGLVATTTSARGRTGGFTLASTPAGARSSSSR